MRILIIEDEKKTAGFLKKGLTENGYVVDAAHTAKDGLLQVHEADYDLVILDVMLPDKSGWFVFKEMRQKDKSTPVLFLTARDSVEDRVKGLELGADDYLVKPFAFAELLARIKAVLRRGQKDVEMSRLCVGDLTLNLIDRTVSRSGKNIELSAKEFALLEYLMRNAGQVLTRTMILDKIWGYDFDTSSNIIDVHINKLRSKIDKGFDSRLIHTLKGVGYVVKVK